MGSGITGPLVRPLSSALSLSSDSYQNPTSTAADGPISFSFTPSKDSGYIDEKRSLLALADESQVAVLDLNLPVAGEKHHHNIEADAARDGNGENHNPIRRPRPRPRLGYFPLAETTLAITLYIATWFLLWAMLERLVKWMDGEDRKRTGTHDTSKGVFYMCMFLSAVAQLVGFCVACGGLRWVGGGEVGEKGDGRDVDGEEEKMGMHGEPGVKSGGVFGAGARNGLRKRRMDREMGVMRLVWGLLVLAAVGEVVVSGRVVVARVMGW
ncbi:hypothetical protein PMZ80_004272 [Knufia obscura]|uniref:Uncharacterized protein n=1 Tax=Knufia obscura TaxID=1635080 RepID=A0ABR0RSN1_9EURO|nr:hypothetical protein PMZ80_004272 [Knufia obscura]